MRSRVHPSVCRLAGSLVLVVGAALLALGPQLEARADIGPKPTMSFTFEFEGQPVDILSGQQIECDDSTCADGQPLEAIGPQRFTCDTTSCRSLAYGYAQYHKLVIEFADRTRESNVFTKSARSATYTVTVLADSLLVEENPSVGVGGFACTSASLPLLAVGLALLRRPSP